MRVKLIVDYWLRELAARWTSGATEPVDLSKLEDMPPLPGDVSIAQFIAEIRSRDSEKKSPALVEFIRHADHTESCEYRVGYYDESARCDCGLVASRKLIF